MADFRTHIGTSTMLGAAYGATAHLVFDVPLPTAVLGGGLCGVSGMLPDLDSGPGIPLRESMAFAAAVVPMMMIDRFRHYGMSPESMVLAGAAIYLTIRFGLAWALKKYTVHRGMFHSLPAAAIAGLVAYLVCASGGFEMRCFKAGGVVLGFLSHLLLDELWSMQLRWSGVKFKKSFGTAFKLYSNSGWANVSTYGKLAILIAAVTVDPVWVSGFLQDVQSVPQVTTQPNTETQQR